MKPGRDLDALVAEKVFGMPPPGDRERIGDKGYWTVGDKEFVHMRPWSIDIAAAWEVAREVFDESIEIVKMLDGRYRVKDSTGMPDFESEGESVPHAICLAALKAISRSP